jgi:hypothetical protein
MPRRLHLGDRTNTMQSLVALANPEMNAAVEIGYVGSAIGALRYDKTWLVMGSVSSLNSWHHFTYVFDGSQNYFYIDGKLASTSNLSNQAAPVTSFQIGRWISGTNYFKGRIDELRIYDRALDSEEIQSAMNTPISGSQTSMLQSGDMSSEVEGTSVSPAHNAAVSLVLSSSRYGPNDTVSISDLWIINPSGESGNVEVKIWMELSGVSPISLTDSLVDETMLLTPWFQQNFGEYSLMQLSGSVPSGIGQVNARLLDPISGDILSEDINQFTISPSRRGRWRSGYNDSLPSVGGDIPVALESRISDSRTQYIISNDADAEIPIEVKSWIEDPNNGTSLSLFSVGSDGSLVLAAGSTLMVDPLGGSQIPAGTYVMKTRILNPITGEILAEK